MWFRALGPCTSSWSFYEPIRFGDYALWFASKSYQHMANEPAPPDAVVAPGARATEGW